MPDHRRNSPALAEILFHWMTGTVLGVLCAGLTLLIHPDGALIDGWPASLSARLGFLVIFGISFGFGAALTGTMFSVFERF